MKNKTYYLTFTLLLFFTYNITAQVGINTTTPSSSLDIVGNPTVVTDSDGLLAPRITGDQLRLKTSYGADQEGTLLYVTVADTNPSGQTVNVTQTGYYYFDGTVWQLVITSSAATDNLYTIDGTLINNRIVTQGNNTLAFTSDITNAFSVDSETFSVDADNNRVGIGTIQPTERLQVNGDTRLGLINPNIGGNFAPNYGNRLYFSGTLGNSLGDSDNSDPMWISRFNASTDASEMRISIGDVPGITTDIDALNVGYLRGNNSWISSLFVSTNKQLIGIRTEDPTATLDVNGNTRLRTIPAGIAADGILTTDINGNLRQRTAAEVVDAGGGITDNLYTADGTLASDRTITTNGNLLTIDVADDGSNRFRLDDDRITLSRDPQTTFEGLMTSKSGMYYIIDSNNGSAPGNVGFSWGSNASPDLGSTDPNFQELMNLNEFGGLTLTVPDSRLRLTAINNNIVRVGAAATSDNWDLTLPENNGIDGQVLTTDGTGNTRWESSATPLETLATAVVRNSPVITVTTTNGNPGSTPGETVNFSQSINFNAKTVDPGNNFDLATDTYTAPLTGSYLITLTASPNNSPGINQSGFYYAFNLQVVNTTNNVILADNRSIRYATPRSAFLGSASSLQGIVSLTAGDVINPRIAFIAINNVGPGATEGLSCPDQITFAPQTTNRAIFSIVKL